MLKVGKLGCLFVEFILSLSKLFLDSFIFDFFLTLFSFDCLNDISYCFELTRISKLLFLDIIYLFFKLVAFLQMGLLMLVEVSLEVVSFLS